MELGTKVVLREDDWVVQEDWGNYTYVLKRVRDGLYWPWSYREGNWATSRAPQWIDRWGGKFRTNAETYFLEDPDGGWVKHEEMLKGHLTRYRLEGPPVSLQPDGQWVTYEDAVNYLGSMTS